MSVKLVGRRREATTDHDGSNVALFENTFLSNIIVSNAGVLVEDEGSRNATWKGNIVWPVGEYSLGILGQPYYLFGLRVSCLGGHT